MSREKQIKSTDWITRDIPKEQLEREKQEAIMSVDLELCHTEFMSGVGEIYTDYDTTAQKMYDKGYRKQSEGEWLEIDDGVLIGDGKHLECSECGVWKKDKQRSNFCSNCGARMLKGGAEE
jgi:hypothetical protein